jgi:hypothetical protein
MISRRSLNFRTEQFKSVIVTIALAATLLVALPHTQAQGHGPGNVYVPISPYTGPSDYQIKHDSQERAKQKAVAQEKERQEKLDGIEQKLREQRETERKTQLERFAQEQRQKEQREKEWLEKRQRTEAERRLHQEEEARLERQQQQTMKKELDNIQLNSQAISDLIDTLNALPDD